MKKFKNLSKSVLVVLTGIMFITFSACTSGEKKADEKSQEISILYPNWAEGIAFTHLAKVALDDKGYNVKITPIAPGPIYASLAKGDADIMMDAWLPNTHKQYWDKYGDKLEKIGESFSGGTTGLVVPQYLDVNTIEELKDNYEMFDSEIIGIGSGSGIHANTIKAIDAYALEMEQITSSGAAMMAALKRAYDKEEAIVITGWKPHYMWADYDLKYLEDTKKIYPADVCAIVTRLNFAKENPVVGEFLKNFNLEEAKLYKLMGMIKEGNDPIVAAKEFYKENKVLVESWMPEKMKK
ncbi:MAG: glycine betaine ABC transporter substrate-binding protein [Bacteroidota bacterium]|nr:glycine betaine ABC transporter substrate-binding protein [Bacteroidota bacterium]